MILLSTLNVFRHLIRGNDLNWLLESDLQDTVDWGKSNDFNTGKTQFISLHCSSNTGAIDENMDGSVLEEKNFFLIGIHSMQG